MGFMPQPEIQKVELRYCSLASFSLILKYIVFALNTDCKFKKIFFLIKTVKEKTPIDY